MPASKYQEVVAWFYLQNEPRETESGFKVLSYRESQEALLDLMKKEHNGN